MNFEPWLFNNKMTGLAVDTLRRISSDLSAFTDGRDIPEDVLDSFIVSMEFVYRELSWKPPLN